MWGFALRRQPTRLTCRAISAHAEFLVEKKRDLKHTLMLVDENVSRRWADAPL